MADAEIDAMQTVAVALAGLDEPARARVLAWAASRYGLGPSAPMQAATPVGMAPPPHVPQALTEESATVDPGSMAEAEGQAWEHFAEVFDAANPATEPQKLLVAAYWVQVVKGAQQFGAYVLNKELKDLGHGTTHISRSMDSLIRMKPSQILQLKKSGKSQQARKTYKLTRAGADEVERMIARGA